MRLLDRLIATSFLRIFVAFVAAVPLLFLVGDLTENIDEYLDRGLPMVEVFRAYGFQILQFVFWSFPMATLIAAVFTVHAMSVHREIVAAKAGGISFHRLVVPALALGIALSGMSFYISDIVPRANRAAFDILEERNFSRDWRINFVYQTEEGHSVSVRRLTVTAQELQDVVLEHRPATAEPGTGPTLHAVADRAYFDDESGWTFSDGYMRRLLPDAREQTYRFGTMKTRGFSERPDELLEASRTGNRMTDAQNDRLAQMTRTDIDRQVGIIERSGGDASEYLVEREQRTALAMATFIMVLFGLPLGTSSQRGSAAYGIGVSIASITMYLILFRVLGAAAGAGVLSPTVAAWTPNALFLAMGALLMTRVRT